MSDLTELEVNELSDLIKSGNVSPLEITTACFARIAQHNANLNAFVTLDEEAALNSARAAEAAIQGGQLTGPLQGIPVGHKDLYATAGLRTTGGSRLLENNVPDKDATVVSRLRDAGMIMLGKTNTHEFAYGPTNEISMFGRVANPWNTARISGGSSGGSGAAVAAGLVPIASGSDTGGSIRIPAACCGLSGIKPSYGRVSRAGILPLCWSMDHAGPLARSAKDAALFLQAIAGYDPLDDASAKRAVPDYCAELTGDIRGLKVGVPRAMFYTKAQADVCRQVEQALAVLVDCGASLIDLDVPDVEASAAAAMAIYLAEATAYHDENLADKAHLYDDSVRSFLELGEQILAKDYLRAQQYRRLLGQHLLQVFEQVDVIATPTLPVTATPFSAETVNINDEPDGVMGALLRNTEPFNLTGLPAAVAPCGNDSDGMPVSLQIIGPAFTEGRVLNVLHAYQTQTDWHKARPVLA